MSIGMASGFCGGCECIVVDCVLIFLIASGVLCCLVLVNGNVKGG
jgi:hypothetical protein